MSRLASIVRGLLAGGVAAEDLDIAVLRDALWLAVVVAAKAVPEAPRSDPPSPAEVSPVQPNPNTVPPADGTIGPADDSVNLYPDATTKALTGRPAASVLLRAPTPLPDAPALTRALRPFRRARRAGPRRALDMEATVRATVEAGGLLQPVLRWLPEARITVHLVVDDAASMAAWARPLTAVTDVLRRANAFAAVECWQLADAVDHPVIHRRPTGSVPAEPPWLRAGGDDVVLLATEARDERWRSEAWWDAVREWGRHASVALLNPLPPAWWGRTALPQQAVRIHAQTHALSNLALTTRLPRRMRAAAAGLTTMPLPVLTLAAGDLLAWSQTVTSAHPEGCLGVLLGDGLRPGPRRTATGAEAVAGFRRLAGPSARRLAVLLSAGETHTIETMRIVQEELVPGSPAADLAQVLAGGLLQQDAPGVFRFEPGARQELHAELRADDAYRVHRCLRITFERRAGPHVVRALIEDPAGAELLPPRVQAFAAASLSALSASGYYTRARLVAVPVPPAGPEPAGGSNDPRGTIFFLSYARAWPIRSQAGPQDVNRFVVRLFDDLSMHVDQLLGSPTGVDAGFMDRSMEGGTRWAPEVLEAAGTCHVFIPLISSSYVESKWCAMEWDAFWRRNVIRRPSDSSGNKTAILPVKWSPMREDQLPPAVRELQFFLPQQLTDPDIAQRYLVDGVYGLLAQDHKTDYQAVAWCLARGIVDAYHAYHVEPMIPTDPGQLSESFRGDDG